MQLEPFDARAGLPHIAERSNLDPEARHAVRIPLPTYVLDGPLSRILVPALFAAAGIATLVWGVTTPAAGIGPERFAPHIVGVGLTLAGIAGVRSELRRREAREADLRALEKHADAPWRVRPEWRSRELAAPEASARSIGPVAIFWNLVSWPLAFFVLRAEADSGDPAVWLILLFPLVGLAMLVPVALEWLRARKFGRVVVELDQLPGRLGRPLGGTLRAAVPERWAPERGVRLQVSCYRQRVRYGRDSDGDRTRRVERGLLWRDEAYFHDKVGWDGVSLEVPFQFDLPAEPPASTPLELENRILWEISADAEVPGLDLRARVEIPVFQAEADVPAASGFAEEVEAASGGGSRALRIEEPAVEWSVDQPLTKGIRLVEEADHFELHFTAARTRPGALLMGVLAVVFILVGVVATPGAILLGPIFIATGAFLVYASIQQATNDTVLSIEGGWAEVLHDGIGMPPDVQLRADRVTGVEVHLSGQGSSDRAYYTLSLVALPGEGLEEVEAQMENFMRLISRFGVGETHPAMEALRDAADQPRIAVAHNLTDKAEADWLASRIRAALARESGTDAA